MTEVASEREHPVLIFDADCAFCTRCVEVFKKLPTGASVTGWQFTDLDRFGVTEDRAMHEVLWVDTRGRVYGGAQAIAKLLIAAGGLLAPVGWLMRTPPLRWIAA